MSSGQSISAADVIDSLPDSVLCYILSFLPTKDAAVTGVLSKRWKPLWLSLFTLDFDDNVFPNFRRFRYFVYSALFSRDSVRSLRLKCGISKRFDPGDINVFLYAAALKGIENLHLHMYCKILLPNCVFSCRTLVVVKLQNLILGGFCYVHFPLLKSLHLDDVLFESRGHVTKFLCGCPNLEDLQAKTLQVGPKEAEEEEVKSLNKLVRVNISESYIPFDVLCNAEFFSARLDFRHCFYNPRFHNLTHMELIFEYMGCDVKWKWLVEVLQNCPKLQNLTIHEESAFVNPVGGVHWKEPQIVVPECLSSQLRTFTLRYFEGIECEVRFAKYILQNSKVLCNMIIHSTCLDMDLKHQMLNNFSVCPRGSATCILLFDW